jgi:hypothetical protein
MFSQMAVVRYNRVHYRKRSDRLLTAVVVYVLTVNATSGPQNLSLIRILPHRHRYLGPKDW